MGNRLRKLIAAESICGLFYDIVFAYEFLFFFKLFGGRKIFSATKFFVLFIILFTAQPFIAQTLTLCGFRFPDLERSNE